MTFFSEQSIKIHSSCCNSFLLKKKKKAKSPPPNIKTVQTKAPGNRELKLGHTWGALWILKSQVQRTHLSWLNLCLGNCIKRGIREEAPSVTVKLQTPYNRLCSQRYYMVHTEKSWLSDGKTQFPPLYSQEYTIEIDLSNERVTLVLGTPGTIHDLWGFFFPNVFYFNCKFVPYASKKWTSETIKLQNNPFLHTQFVALEENLSNHPRKVFSRQASCSCLNSRDREEVVFFNRSGVWTFTQKCKVRANHCSASELLTGDNFKYYHRR